MRFPLSVAKNLTGQISKKLVSSDYKNHRVDDPTKISSRQEKQVKKYVQGYFEKAVAKKKAHDRHKAERKAKEGESNAPLGTAAAPEVKREEDDSDRDQDMAISDDEDTMQNQDSTTPITPLDQALLAEGLKRKREAGDDSATREKRLKSESPPPQPPPPPPPAADMPSSGSGRLVDEDALCLGVPADDGMGLESDMQGNVVGTHRPPPPPPPLGMGSVDDEDEHVGRHERHFPGRGHEQLREVQV